MKATLADSIAPDQACSGLFSVSPATIDAGNSRLLFQNEFISLALVSLKPGQRLQFARPMLRLLTVACGRVRLFGPDGSLVLQESGTWRLERGEQWEIIAQTNARVSLFIVKPAANG